MKLEFLGNGDAVRQRFQTAFVPPYERFVAETKYSDRSREQYETTYMWMKAAESRYCMMHCPNA